MGPTRITRFADHPDGCTRAEWWMDTPAGVEYVECELHAHHAEWMRRRPDGTYEHLDASLVREDTLRRLDAAPGDDLERWVDRALAVYAEVSA